MSKYHKPLFDLMYNHGVILIEDEMDEIIQTVNSMQPSIAITELEEILTSQLPAPAKVNQLMILIENYKTK